MARIIVVGSGVAGLAAAARMATGANDVTLIERNGSPGGSLIWATPDTLTLPAVLRDLFVKTGGRKASAAGKLEEVVDLRPIDPVRTYRFPDGSSLDLPNAARGASKDAFDAAFGHGAGDAWLRVVDHGNRAWSAVRPTLVEVPDAGRRDLWRLFSSSAARRALAPRRTLRQIGEAAGVRDPRMMRVLDEYAQAAGAAPETAPSVIAIRPYIEQTFGAWRIVGGLPELATALYERCLKRGVSFRFDTEVTSIAAGSVTLADGERLSADVIVAAVDAHVLARLTGTVKGSKAAPADYSPSILSIRLESRNATETTPATETTERAYETVLFGEGDEQPTIRLRVAPERPNEWIAYADVALSMTSQDAEELKSAIAKRLGIAAESLTVREVFTPGDRERLTSTPGGSLHGPAISSLNSAILRSPTVQPIKGLLHVGPSARPGPGIAFAALSAWNAAEVLKPTRV
ncbi:phytoene desaturase family protein [Actinospica sp.]|uniref:phytoene desaturase family protein n=1 Tax=Actinospica sp. TaxID=1872142 RepID=UPI002C867837|nr:FAD-dependent oxidoreductase [Actinospica sp.]HWG22841.1 FAD-dependent oxidoreductase [Actinospica sp.]